jgi:NDP-sugar pyrophosphorylase family protein
LIPAGENSSFEYNVFPELLAREKQFFRLCHERQLLARHRNAGQLPASSSRFFRRENKRFKIDKSTESDVATAAIVDKHSILGDGCIVKPNARITNSVIGAGVHIEEKAVVENSVVWAHTRISSQVQIHNAICRA